MTEHKHIYQAKKYKGEKVLICSKCGIDKRAIDFFKSFDKEQDAKTQRRLSEVTK